MSYLCLDKHLSALPLTFLILGWCTGHALAEEAKPPPGASPPSVWTEQLTSDEIGLLIKAGFTTVLIPTGGIEENGPYLATGKHNVILEETCPVIAARLGNALCAPIVKFVPEGTIDPPSGAMKYPGTISLREETYEALLVDIGASLAQSGFTDLIYIGDSGGNQRGMAKAADLLNARWDQQTTTGKTRAHFVLEYYDPGWEATENYTRKILGVSEGASDGFHDDIWVTAMMMAQDPELVRYSQREANGTASINGVSITPAARTIELGRAMIAFRAKLAAEAIETAIDQQQLDP